MINYESKQKLKKDLLKDPTYKNYLESVEKKQRMKKDLLKDPTYKNFLERVEKIRENKNLSQYVFAESLGVSQGTYNSLIHGRITSAYIIWQIIKLMKGDLRWLEENTEV